MLLNQDSSVSPDEGRLPDANQGIYVLFHQVHE